MDEYRRELINEILVELSNIKNCVEVIDESGFSFSEQRIKIILEMLRGK